MNISHPSNAQRGAVLIVGLIMLLLLTIVGLASIRGSNLQELMTGNMRDHNLAFQAAESGLRVGELAAVVGKPDTTTGYYKDLNQTGALHARPAEWLKENWDAWSIRMPESTLTNVSKQPQYIVEKVQPPASAVTPGGAIDVESKDKVPTPTYYRVTSRGLGGTTDSEVIVQSTYKPN